MFGKRLFVFTISDQCNFFRTHSQNILWTMLVTAVIRKQSRTILLDHFEIKHFWISNPNQHKTIVIVLVKITTSNLELFNTSKHIGTETKNRVLYIFWSIDLKIIIFVLINIIVTVFIFSANRDGEREPHPRFIDLIDWKLLLIGTAQSLDWRSFMASSEKYELWINWTLVT